MSHIDNYSFAFEVYRFKFTQNKITIKSYISKFRLGASTFILLEYKVSKSS